MWTDVEICQAPVQSCGSRVVYEEGHVEDADVEAPHSNMLQHLPSPAAPSPRWRALLDSPTRPARKPEGQTCGLSGE